VLGSVEILTRELPDARGDAFIQPSFLNPPRIETGGSLAGHTARTGQENQGCAEIATSLPESSSVEIQSLLTDQRAEVDVDRSAKSVPTCKAIRLLALEVPEGIADVLKIEFHAALEQARPLATPLPEEMAVWPLTRFVTIRAGERFLLRSLRTSRKSEQAYADTQGKQ